MDSEDYIRDGRKLVEKFNRQTRALAKVLHEELERDGWGDIEPWCIRCVAEGDFVFHEDALDLSMVFRRVVQRLDEVQGA